MSCYVTIMETLYYTSPAVRIARVGPLCLTCFFCASGMRRHDQSPTLRSNVVYHRIDAHRANHLSMKTPELYRQILLVSCHQRYLDAKCFVFGQLRLLLTLSFDFGQLLPGAARILGIAHLCDHRVGGNACRLHGDLSGLDSLQCLTMFVLVHGIICICACVGVRICTNSVILTRCFLRPEAPARSRQGSVCDATAT